jgi:hypothetical protein
MSDPRAWQKASKKERKKMGSEVFLALKVVFMRFDRGFIFLR